MDINELKEQAKQDKATIEKLTEENAAKDELITEAESKVQESNSQAEEAKSQLAAANEQVAKLTEENTKLSSDLKESLEKVETLEANQKTAEELAAKMARESGVEAPVDLQQGAATVGSHLEYINSLKNKNERAKYRAENAAAIQAEIIANR